MDWRHFLVLPCGVRQVRIQKLVRISFSTQSDFGVCRLRMSNSRKFILDVIEKYRERPCLWQVTHQDYHNKMKRNKALDDFLELFRSVDGDANRETVQKKLASMRSSFNKEQRKIKASLVSGACANDVHVPKLWYFDHLTFLADQDMPRKSMTPIILLDDSPYSEDENEATLDNEESEFQVSCGNSSTRSSSNLKRLGQKVDHVSDKTARRIEQPIQASAKQPHDAYGEHIAEKLRSLPPSMIPFCQKLINEAIFFAELEHLNLTSRIVTEQLPSSPIPYPPLT